MITVRIAILSFALLLFAVAQNISGATPSIMSYQGRLTDAGGAPLTGTYSVLFTIYDDPVASAPANNKWQETHPAVSVSAGLFTVLLGSGSPAVPLTDLVFDGSTRYLSIKVGADPEISPRIRLASSAFANRVSTVDGARGGSVFDSIRVVTPAGLSGLSMFILPNFTAIRFYEPVSVMPPLRLSGQPLLTELSDTALLMFPHTGLAVPVDTNISLSADGKIRASSTIEVGFDAAAPGQSAAAFGAADTASGAFSIVAGGQNNLASGDYSFAAGHRAQAVHNHAFVWADSLPVVYPSVSSNTFSVRASNGFVLGSNAGTAKVIKPGDHYRDNGIVAWAHVDAAGTVGSGQFGLQTVTRDSAGVYTIIVDANALSAHELIPVVTAEVDAPPTSPILARLIYVDQIAANMFKVYITHGNYVLVDNAFVFMATAR